MPFQSLQELAGACVPEFDLFVITAGGEPLAVGRKLCVVQNVVVALEMPDERAVGDVPDRRLAPKAGDARGGDQPIAVIGEMQGIDLPGKLAQRAWRRNRPGRVGAVEADRGAASHGEPAAVARRVHCDDRPHLRVRGDLGHVERQAVRPLALWSCAPASIQAAIKAISSAPGRGSPLGGISGLAAPFKRRTMRLAPGSPGRIAGPCAVPRCSDA